MPDGVPFLLVSLDISDILLLQLLKSMVETGLTALSSNRKAPDSADARHMNGQTGGHYGRHFLQNRIIYLGAVFRHFRIRFPDQYLCVRLRPERKEVHPKGHGNPHPGTGEDYTTAERKNKDPFSFRPYARFLFSCNEIPRNYGDRSDGFFRRLILIRFNRSIPPSKQDKLLREKLATERDGIFMWALEGLRRLMANNYTFFETASTHAELEKYRTESSSSLSFARYYLETAPDAVCVRDDVYEQYKHYCMDSGVKNMSQIAFSKEIEARFPSIQCGRDRVSKRRIWEGLRFVPDGLEIDA